PVHTNGPTPRLSIFREAGLCFLIPFHGVIPWRFCEGRLDLPGNHRRDSLNTPRVSVSPAPPGRFRPRQRHQFPLYFSVSYSDFLFLCQNWSCGFFLWGLDSRSPRRRNGLTGTERGAERLGSGENQEMNDRTGVADSGASSVILFPLLF